MISKSEFFNYLKNNSDKEFSKEEIINLFSTSLEDEDDIDKMLSEIEVEYTYNRSNLFVTCKAGTVYFKWTGP